MNLIDKIITEHIMHWTHHMTFGAPDKQDVIYLDADGQKHTNFEPSTNKEDAFVVLDVISGANDYRAIIDYERELATISMFTKEGRITPHFGVNPSLALAICQVALSTLGIDLDALYDDDGELPPNDMFSFLETTDIACYIKRNGVLSNDAK